MRRIYYLLLVCLCCTSLFAKTKKAVYIIIDGVPADQIERLHTPAIFDIASRGAYARAYTGGEIGQYSQTATISAIGYTNLLTATWFNKHNVGGNSDLQPNYNYWTIFRIAKEQPKDYKTAIYSSWTDNRTVLIGEGKKETNHLKIDYVKDGYDLDTIRFPKKEKDLHIFDIDEQISKDAAEGIRKDAPDLSWVYLWYTDDAGHIAGNGAFFDEYVRKADDQVARIWEAVKYREANFDEEWMIVVTTDHGRGENGHGHGGQSWRERTTWISTNVPVNSHFTAGDWLSRTLPLPFVVTWASKSRRLSFGNRMACRSSVRRIFTIYRLCLMTIRWNYPGSLIPETSLLRSMPLPETNLRRAAKTSG